ncbi:uncharacterized protein LOC102206249 [Pundamilia nyererei]|uniref:Uncharacterized protein LOC102206249 n=1 Tax=Pundamilia nyererei TaxID=303518 RepID=A0A9Y3S7Y0_9CICH|nr:PREDICTED: uncharacterized protein LOC102206249 [Pundamilia nyererei]
MALLRSKSALLWFLIVVAAHIAETGGRPRRQVLLTEGDSTVSLRSRQPPAGPEPGDPADAFKVPTLDGEFSFQPDALRGPLVIHAFTNNSGFLECLWSSESSLKSLVEELPNSTQVLFLSLDDSVVNDVLWMREQVLRAAAHSKKEVLSRLHFSPVPVFALGNWIPRVLYYWSCMGHGCGLSQAAFISEEWKMPVIIKRLDARYDWLMARWGSKSYTVIDAGDGCETFPSVAGAVAWVSEGNCSFFTKVQSMAKSNASGVLVYTLPGNPLQDMNCVGDECFSLLSIPAAMVHQDPAVAQTLRFGKLVNVSFQNTPSPNFFISIDKQGLLAEMGWFLYPTFSFVNWQAQWFDFFADLQTKLQNPAKVVSVFDKVQMQGDKGAVATVDLSIGIGRWLTDVSPLIPLLDSNKCTFTMKTVPWAMPWIVSLNLRFSGTNQTGNSVESFHPFKVMSLYDGGTFDKNYNKRYQPIKFTVPASTKKVELYAVITGHGSDENGCGEFCVTSHHFVINAAYNNTHVFDSAGTALGCAMRVKEGAVPNEHGTWLYGRGGWCDGLQVNPWRVDVTKQLNMSRSESNTVVYFGLFNGRDPNPAQQPGYIIMTSSLVFYK